jgi:hypothetical protein
MLLFRRGCEQPLRPELRAALGVLAGREVLALDVGDRSKLLQIVSPVL